MKVPPVMLACLAWLLHISCVWGQFYSTGEAPSSLRWKKINTPHFSIIFPEEITDDAIHLAGKLEQYKAPSEAGLNFRVKRFPVLLHSTTVLSNGYVTLAPKRMELVAAPPQDGYAQDWITQLTLHEYRHTVQLSKLNQGFTRTLSWVTGEIAPGGVSSMLPSWFYEGDAVYNETRLSATGRGRIPGFSMPLRTILLQESGRYSYDKAVFGSYRNYVPDQYRYGYPLVEYARSRYGDSIWSGAIDYTARHPFYIWPLSFYLKKNFGIYKEDLYDQMIDSLKYQYYKQEDTIIYIDYRAINARKNKIYTSYLHGKDLANGQVIALRTGLADPGSFVVLDSAGRERKLFTTGYSNRLKADMAGNLVVWDEVRTDPRWNRRDYSILRVYDLNSGNQRTLTSRTRYFSPDFSPGADRIAAVETDIGNKSHIVILDVRSGELLTKVTAPAGTVFQFPEWISETMLVAVTVAEDGKRLVCINLEDQVFTELIPATRMDISEPVRYGKFVLFRASYTGLENLYAINTVSRRLYQVTFSRFGAFHPSISADSSELLFSNYGMSGFDVVRIPVDTTTWLEVTADQNSRTVHAAQTSKEAGFPVNPVPYRKGSGLLHFHSWLPFYFDMEDVTGTAQDIRVDLGAMVFSQNLLSTFISSIGYRYAEGYHQFIPRLTWRGWYPVIELSGNFGGSHSTFSLLGHIPLYFAGRRYSALLDPQLEYEYEGLTYPVGDEVREGINYLHTRLTMSRYIRLSPRDLYPRWGQYLTATYTGTPFEKEIFGQLYSFQGGAYFPGVARHHHFFVQCGYQRQLAEYYLLPVNRISFPRGYPSAVSEELSTLLLNYAFPAGYPDLALGPFLYLKRFRVNLFHDLGYGTRIREWHGSEAVYYTGSYRSYGAEMLADMHIIRFIFPLSAGVRLGYLPGRNEMFYEGLLSIDTGVF